MANFLSLPAELRNEMYALVFCATSKKLRCPWDDGRSCIKDLSLFLVYRQVNVEAPYLFWRDHAQNVLFHFHASADFECFIHRSL